MLKGAWWRKQTQGGASFQDLAGLSPGKRVPGVVHDTVKVIDFSQRVHLPGLHLQKVVLLTCEWRRTESPDKTQERSCSSKLMYVKGEYLLQRNKTHSLWEICRLVVVTWPTDVSPSQSSSSTDKPGKFILVLFSDLPGWMLSLIMLTCSSRSGRVCSCQNPITWPSSCTTMPNLSQFFPIDMAWGPPPRRPT